MIIGYTNPGYPVRRTILNRCSKAQYVRSRSYSSVLGKIRSVMRLPNRGLLKTGCTYLGGTADKKVDLFHFFNLIACGLGGPPYVTTFETAVPRFLEYGDYWYHKALESLSSDRCCKLIAISNRAVKCQMHVLRKEGLSDVARKMVCILPPQEVLIDSIKAKMSGGPIRFLFVGKDFFRKGGAESLRALCQIRKHANVELFLIGDYEHVDYMSSWTVDNAEEMRRLIAVNSDWVHYYHSMSNAAVLELAKKCDVGLLPSRHDTFGYSVLEFQASGLPCITTDVCALTEINNNSCGWVVKTTGGACLIVSRDRERSSRDLWRDCGESRLHCREGITRLSARQREA